MKQDEIDLILGKKVEINRKRKQFILEKWERKGWGKEPNYTDEFYRIKNLIENRDKCMDEFEGQVVTMYSKKYYPPMVGILEDSGDNGWYFYTSRTIKKGYSYFIGYLHSIKDIENVAYFDLHPNPRKIWNRLNYLAWKYKKHPDRFHNKIGVHDNDTVRNYRIENGKFIWGEAFNPDGNIGDCRSYCPCRKIK